MVNITKTHLGLDCTYTIGHWPQTPSRPLLWNLVVMMAKGRMESGFEVFAQVDEVGLIVATCSPWSCSMGADAKAMAVRRRHRT